MGTPVHGGPTAGAARLRVQLGDGSGTPTAEAHQKGAAVSTTNGIAKLWKPVVNVCVGDARKLSTFDARIVSSS